MRFNPGCGCCVPYPSTSTCQTEGGVVVPPDTVVYKEISFTTEQHWWRIDTSIGTNYTFYLRYFNFGANEGLLRAFDDCSGTLGSVLVDSGSGHAPEVYRSFSFTSSSTSIQVRLTKADSGVADFDWYYEVS